MGTDKKNTIKPCPRLVSGKHHWKKVWVDVLEGVNGFDYDKAVLKCVNCGLIDDTYDPNRPSPNVRIYPTAS